MTPAQHLASQLVDSVADKLAQGAEFCDTPANRAADKRKIARAIQRIVDKAVATATRAEAITPTPACADAGEQP